jgi:zinc transporter ZupT
LRGPKYTRKSDIRRFVWLLSSIRAAILNVDVWMALLFGVVTSSALLLEAFIGVRFELPKRILAMILSFAAGALITALTFELFQDAYERGGIWLAATGLFIGAVVFTVLSARLDRWAQAGSRPVPADEYRGSPKLDTDAAATGRSRRRPPPGVRRLGAACRDLRLQPA